MRPFLSAALVPLLSATALAQNRAPRPYELGEVIVSARRPVSEASGTVRLITADDIQVSGARTLEEALELLPGLDVRTGSDGVPRINVRGFRPRHLLLLLDGVPLNSTYDAQFDPTLLPVEEIAFVKLTPGPSSVLYGAGPLAGTINIVTRSGAGRARGDVQAEARAQNTTLLRLSAGAGTARISAFGAASGFETDGYPTSSGPALRVNSDRNRVSMFGTVTAAAAKHLTLGLVLSGVRGAYGIPTTAVRDAADPFANRATYERVPALEQRSVQLAAGYAPPGPVSMRSWTYVNQYDEDHNRYDDSTYSSTSDSTVRGTYRQASRSRVTGLGTQVAVERARWGRVTLGLVAERHHWSSDLSIRDVALGGGRFGIRDVTDARRLGRLGVALEYEFHPANGSGVVLGYALDRLAKDSAGTERAGSYSAAAYYDVVPRTRVRVAAAHKVRFPTVSQLYDPTAGNPALRSERADEYEAGIEQTLPGQSVVAVITFRTDVRGFIERPAPSQPFANFSVYRFSGVEIVASTEAVARLSLRTGYSFLDARDRSPGTDRPTLQYRPRHKMTFEARYASSIGLDALLSTMRVAGQVYYSRTTPAQQADLPSYTLVNLRVAQRLPGSTTRLYVGADNLLNEAYQQEYGYPQASRRWYAGAFLEW